MSATLYNQQILRLAASVPFDTRLPEPHGSSEKRSPVCGSRVTVDVRLDDAGQVAEIGMRVRACALGQAAAALMAEHAVGKSAADLAEARDALTAWLAGSGPVPAWPGLDLFEPALPHSARHPSVRLAFEAATEAAETARTQAPAG
ncbi:iron-sulfur cluster assembly scaffold protein [Sphingomonas sp. Y38-1Y]|uniref:iron-sulfur cluster assembly scaffold protein n=1 Tax=Sphingomonas sp. Y38-1Y TaxID=3078265 RepID=UPI0028F144DF|nr:iron-sulfur cluster assembly scaffold protein [Sphingomonas sp. Y38-1Y]